eukprot:738521-Prorocentrum_lima.AAC.1
MPKRTREEDSTATAADSDIDTDAHQAADRSELEEEESGRQNKHRGPKELKETFAWFQQQTS